MTKVIQYLLSSFLLCLLISSCAPTRHLQPKEVLLVKNKVENLKKFNEDPLKDIIKQDPNRKLIGFWRFHLQMWNLGYNYQDKRIGFWLMNSIGEKPVILDTFLVRKSKEQMQEYLFQEGYFKAQVTDSIAYLPKNSFIKKKAKVYYTQKLGEPYIIKKVNTYIQDSTIQYLEGQIKDNTVLKVGARYQYSLLEEERKRLTALMQKNGYYDFNKSYIRFVVDTTQGDYEVALSLKIQKPEKGNPHAKYKLGKTLVYPNYDLLKSYYPDTISNGKLKFVYDDKMYINQKMLKQSIFLDHENFSTDHIEQTYRKLTGLNVYAAVSVEMEKSTEIPNTLNAKIHLTPAPKHSFVIESRLENRANGSSGDEEGSTSSALNLGVSGSFSLLRRNAFKNGELLKIGITAGLEPFFLSDSTMSSQFFNTVQFGPSLEITFPRFLLPISQDKFSKKQDPKTKLTLGYNLLRNDDLVRRSATASWQYRWFENQLKQHIFTLAEVSIVDAFLSESLSERLQNFGDPFLENSYRDQFILASSYTYIYNQPITKNGSRLSYRGKLEVAGNTLRTITPLFKEANSDGSYEIFDIAFAQYALIENDLRWYKSRNGYNNFATRLYAGLGKPYNNLNSLPFEKSFFSGGANGIRAWRARSLGPGSFSDTTFSSGILNQIGEIKLETNLEYRFKIISFMHGALFADIGNTWMLKERGDRNNVEFGSEFYKQLAVGTGVGLRFDFEFFIIRFDTGLQTHDPSLPEGERWIFQSKEKYNAIIDRYNSRQEVGGSYQKYYSPKVNFSLGIGYPF